MNKTVEFEGVSVNTSYESRYDETETLVEFTPLETTRIIRLKVGDTIVPVHVNSEDFTNFTRAYFVTDEDVPISRKVIA